MMNYAVLGRSLAVLLATSTVAQAQTLTLPKTIKLHSNQTGEPLGTVTISDGKAYFRDKDGKHFATSVRNRDGTITSFDPSGNVIAPVKPPPE